MSMIVSTLSMIPVLFVNDIITFTLWAALNGATLGGIIIGREVIFGDIIDEDELKYGVRREGCILGVIVSLEKLSAVIVGVSTAVVLSLIGYVQTLDPLNQPLSVGIGMRWGMLGFQVVFMILTVLSLKFYPLTKQRCDEIAAKLEEKRVGKGTYIQEQ